MQHGNEVQNSEELSTAGPHTETDPDVISVAVLYPSGG